MSGKTIVTNMSVLTTKYGVAGVTRINAAIKALIAADGLRGIVTTVSSVDDPTLGGATVTNPSDPAQNKKAVDAICAKNPPDFLMILGSVDVIPHQDLINPCYGPNDPDQYAWSDLPYACPGRYSQQISDFYDPIRVVGRLPDLTGATTPDYLLGLLAIAANYTSRPALQYSSYLGVTAQVWAGSTSLSLTNTFGSSTNMKDSPPNGPMWSATEIQPRSHFFNCHGAPLDPNFYGQDTPTNFPIAHQASYLAGRITEGTVSSCECCYGAELYDPAPVGQMGIGNTYLAEGAYAYFGSTTIAYGPATGNGAADLICQYFLQSILTGASAGRAVLDARQKFILGLAPVTPIDAKTVAQFILLADPSIQPVVSPPAPKFFTKGTGVAVKEDPLRGQARWRALRRARLEEIGWSLPARTVDVVLIDVKLPAEIELHIKERANADGAQNLTITSFSVRNPKSEMFVKALQKEGGTKAVHLAMAKLPTKHPKVIGIVAYVAYETENGFSLDTLYSR